MPWCDPCQRFFNPNSMTAQGSCPVCQADLASSEVERRKAPWHFKLLVVATAGYVGWRLVQLVMRGFEALF